MSDERAADDVTGAADVGAYCRAVERHLTTVNGGHLVRIAGPAFLLVRRWAEAGVPLTVVFHAIGAKAERHRGGASTRPLRLEFCEDDVDETYERWRRAIGMSAATAREDESGDAVESQAARRPALGAHLERAIVRLTRASGRLDLPDTFREAIAATLAEITALRDATRGARGPARDAAAATLATLDAAFRAKVLQTAPAELVDEARHAAEQDLAPYRGRMTDAAWRQAIDVTADRLLRDRLGLPTLEP